MNALQRLKDKNLHSEGFGELSRTSVAPDRRSVLFEFPSGISYRVPVEYLYCWFNEGRPDVPSDLRAVRSRRLIEPKLVRVYFSDGQAHDAAWDTVLMACEPRYEHFGGLTEPSKKLTRKWEAADGRFRVDPQ